MKLWGIWNACQGIFPDTVRADVWEVKALLSGHSYGRGRIVPLVVTVVASTDLNAWLIAESATILAAKELGHAPECLDNHDENPIKSGMKLHF